MLGVHQQLWDGGQRVRDSLQQPLGVEQKAVLDVWCASLLGYIHNVLLLHHTHHHRIYHASSSYTSCIIIKHKRGATTR